MMNNKQHKKNIEIKSIPHGALKLEQVIECDHGKRAIRLLKKMSDDPKARIISFLVAYQTFDMECQLQMIGYGSNPNTQERAMMVSLATATVMDNLGEILSEIGQQGIDTLIKTLS